MGSGATEVWPFWDQLPCGSSYWAETTNCLFPNQQKPETRILIQKLCIMKVEFMLKFSHTHGAGETGANWAFLGLLPFTLKPQAQPLHRGVGRHSL